MKTLGGGAKSLSARSITQNIITVQPTVFDSKTFKNIRKSALGKNNVLLLKGKHIIIFYLEIQYCKITSRYFFGWILEETLFKKMPQALISQ